MSVRRGPRKADHFTILDNSVLTDERLSYRARGVLAAILSKPADWRTRAEQLAAQSPKEGRDAIRAALRELEEVGYLVREKVQGPDGRWSNEATVHETPVEKQQVSPATENPSPVPATENPVPAPEPSPEPEKPASGSPAAGEPGPLKRTRSQRTETKDGSPSRGTSPARGGAREEEPPISPQPDTVERPLTRDTDVAEPELPALRLVDDAMPGGMTAAERRTAVMLLAENGDRHYPVIAHLRAGREQERRGRTFRDETLAVHRRAHERAEDAAVGEGSGAREAAGVA